MLSMASVTPMREHPYECIEINNKNWKFLKKTKKNVFRRQQFKKLFFIDGSFYIIRKHFLQKFKNLLKKIKQIFLFK